MVGTPATQFLDHIPRVCHTKHHDSRHKYTQEHYTKYQNWYRIVSQRTWYPLEKFIGYHLIVCCFSTLLYSGIGEDLAIFSIYIDNVYTCIVPLKNEQRHLDRGVLLQEKRYKG